MAEASRTSPRDRQRRGRRSRVSAEHVGDPCSMCGRTVKVDADGRCPLGHPVVDAEEMQARAAARRERTGAPAEGAEGDERAAASEEEEEEVVTPAPRGGGWPESAAGPVRATPGAEPPPIDLAAGDLPPTAPAAFSTASPGLRSRGVHDDNHHRDADSRDPSAEVVATYVEAGPDAVPPSAPATRTPPVFEDPPPPLPGEADAMSSPPEAPPALPVRVRRRLPPDTARSLFTEMVGTGPARTSSAASAPVDSLLPAVGPPAGQDPLASAVDDPEEPPDGDVTRDRVRDRTAVPRTDLTPSARSALDVEEGSWTTAAPRTDVVYEQEPLRDHDADVEGPRGLLQIVAGGIFVVVLLVLAWYLATTL